MKMNQVVFLMHDRLRSNFFFSFDKKLHVIRLEIRPGKTSLQFCTRSRVSLPSYPMGVLSGGSVVVSRVAKKQGKNRAKIETSSNGLCPFFLQLLTSFS